MPGEEAKTDREDELMLRIASGDGRALDELFVLHRERVFGLAYRYMGSRAEAEDLTQDTFLKVLFAAPTYRPEGTFKTWLLTITTRLCLKKRARHGSWRERLMGLFHPVTETRADEGDDPSESLLRQELAFRVREAVSALPEDQRMAILLSRFEELSYEEIAGVMGKSPQSVTSLLWRARVKLREELGSLTEEDSGESDLATARIPSAGGFGGEAG